MFWTPDSFSNGYKMNSKDLTLFPSGTLIPYDSSMVKYFCEKLPTIIDNSSWDEDARQFLVELLVFLEDLTYHPIADKITD